MMITIVDYGMGNIGSVVNMLKKIGVRTLIVADADHLERAEKIILPGVGSFDVAMNNLQNQGLLETLRRKVLEDKVPILGICLGMQLLTLKSQEGIENGLGFVDAVVTGFNSIGDKDILIPHMGWNHVNVQKQSKLTDGLDLSSRYYFVHSYFVRCKRQDDVLMTTHYGVDFVSAFQHENIFGVQFHPEKSHKYGMRLLKNFVEI